MSSRRIQRGSVARSTWGNRAVVMPMARHSLETALPKARQVSGEKVAAIPRPSGHLDTSPAPDLYSAPAPLEPWRGSLEMFTGMPQGRLSA